MIYTRVRRGVRVCACAREALKKRAGAIFIVEGARPIAFDVWHFSREISLGVTLTAALSSESECVYLYVSRFSQSAASCWCMYIYIACVCEKFRCVRHLHSRFPCRPHLTGELITVFACECRRRRSGNIIGFVILLFIATFLFYGFFLEGYWYTCCVTVYGSFRWFVREFSWWENKLSGRVLLKLLKIRGSGYENVSNFRR